MSQPPAIVPPTQFQLAQMVPPIWFVQRDEVRILATSRGPGAFLYETPEGGLAERHRQDIVQEPAMQLVMIALNPDRPSSPEEISVRFRVTVDTNDCAAWVEAIDGPKPDLMAALEARASALRGREDQVENFATRILAVTGSKRWNEAVSTALLGDWTTSLDQHGHLHPQALGQLRAEARTIHRQLVPLWRRRVRNSRLLLLDAPLGDGLCLYDLVADQADFADARLGAALHDDRLVRLVQHLAPEERLVLVALATGDGTTWTEAATLAGATDPVAFGERVRRKTRRLATRAAERRAAARTTSQAAGSQKDETHGRN